AARRYAFYESFAGARSFGGLDLAGAVDLNAFLLGKPNDMGGFDLVPVFWMPTDNVAKRVREDHVPYDRWIADGWIFPMHGAVRDDDQVVDVIEWLCAPADMQEIAVDPWQSPNIAGKLLQRGVEVVKVAQSFGQLAGPSEELEKMLAAGTLRHDGNAVMSWMVGNAVADVDAAGNRKPSKQDSNERIDGMAALVTLLARAMVAAPPKKRTSQIF
ncbi:MAG: terminase TerL endonuclease subunit, partial [Dehalococcoidia bacterium]